VCQSLRRSLARSLARDASRRPYASRCPAVPLTSVALFDETSRRVRARPVDRARGARARRMSADAFARWKSVSRARVRRGETMRRAFAEWRFVASDAVRRRAARAAVADARRARALARAFSAWRERSARADPARDWRRIARDGRDDADAVGCERGFERLERARANDSARWTRSGIKKCSRRG
jgi:hypothetical protein